MRTAAETPRRRWVWPLMAVAVPAGCFVVFFFLMLASGGCKAEYKMAIRNSTPNPAIVVSRNTQEPVLIPTGDTQPVIHFDGQVLVVSGSNVWVYPAINLYELNVPMRRVPRFGCWCSIQADANLDHHGRIWIENTNFAPVKTLTWP